jgi:hypothetical protein
MKVSLKRLSKNSSFFRPLLYFCLHYVPTQVSTNSSYWVSWGSLVRTGFFHFLSFIQDFTLQPCPSTRTIITQGALIFISYLFVVLSHTLVNACPLFIVPFHWYIFTLVVVLELRTEFNWPYSIGITLFFYNFSR